MFRDSFSGVYRAAGWLVGLTDGLLESEALHGEGMVWLKLFFLSIIPFVLVGSMVFMLIMVHTGLFDDFADRGSTLDREASDIEDIE